MNQHQLDVLRQRALMARCQAHEAGFKRFCDANLGELADALFHLCRLRVSISPGPYTHTIWHSSKIYQPLFREFPARLDVTRADIRAFNGVVRDEWHAVQSVYLCAFDGVCHGFVLFCHLCGFFRLACGYRLIGGLIESVLQAKDLFPRLWKPARAPITHNVLPHV